MYIPGCDVVILLLFSGSGKNSVYTVGIDLVVVIVVVYFFILYVSLPFLLNIIASFCHNKSNMLQTLNSFSFSVLTL